MDGSMEGWTPCRVSSTVSQNIDKSLGAGSSVGARGFNSFNIYCFVAFGKKLPI